MQVEILEYFPEPKNNQIGFVDCKVTYTAEKFEIFRHLSIWKKPGGTISISFRSVKRGEKWVPTFERHPYPKELFDSILKAFEEYRNSHTIYPDQ